MFPSSHCPFCKTRIKPYDMIPIISYIVLRGRCRACKRKISLQYPIVETISLICGILGYCKFGFTINTIAVYFIAFLLIYISAVDIEKFEISNLSILLLFFLEIIYYFTNNSFSIQSVARFFLGGVYSSLLIFLIYVLSKERAMGLGDVLLIFSGGAGFSIGEAIVVNFMSFVLGAIYGIFALMKKKDISDHYIPFAPFLAISIYMTILFGEDIINLYLRLFI